MDENLNEKLQEIFKNKKLKIEFIMLISTLAILKTV